MTLRLPSRVGGGGGEVKVWDKKIRRGFENLEIPRKYSSSFLPSHRTSMGKHERRNGDEVIADVASRRNNENGRRNGAAPARYYRVGAVRRSRSQSVFRALRNNRQTVPLD